MDVKLCNGGIELDSTNKNEIKLSGIDAVLQRIEIALSIPKSHFIYNRDMGICVPDLNYEKERDVLTLEMYINEAICNICRYICKVKEIDTSNNKVVLNIITEKEIIERVVNLGGKL